MHPAIARRRANAGKLGSTYDPGLNDIFTAQTVPDASWSEQLETVAPGVTGVISSQQSGGESWMDTLQRTLPVLAATYQQKQILGIQLARAQAGLPPLDPAALGVGVSVGISPELKQMLVIGGIGLAAVIFMSRGRR